VLISNYIKIEKKIMAVERKEGKKEGEDFLRGWKKNKNRINEK
jgi:hypothetical protein